MPDKKTFYVTTPIYYVNDVPHIGHAYATVGADALARFKRMDGYEVFFLTGTDEHGQKIAKTAKEKGLEPQQLADQVVERFKEAWVKLGITYDRFIRTTDEDHKKAAQAFFKKVQDAGFIYKSDYEGWYCLPDEKFLQDSEVKDGPDGTKRCPDCGRVVERIKEENYFFAMSKFQKQIEKHLEDHPEFLQPESRKNEMVNNFIKPGLADVSITRSTVKWGIPAPVEGGPILYVWFDALINYISALGWPDGENFKKFWPADVHIIGKDILRFHTTIWPAMLMAAGLPLPKKVFGTGFINMGGEKMSKSLGNVISPMEVIGLYGADALRYYLLREVVFGMDGVFTTEAFELRFNGDLANDLGNLVSRTLTMVEKYFDGVIPTNPKPNIIPFKELPNEIELKKTRKMFDELSFDKILENYWDLIKQANKFIGDSTPWKIAEDPGRREDLKRVICNLVEVLRITAIRLFPFMPFTAQKIWEQLGFSDLVDVHSFSETGKWGVLPTGQKIKKATPIFPRIEKKVVENIDENRFIQEAQSALKKKISIYLKESGVEKPDCGWLANSGIDYKQLIEKGMLGFYIRNPDKKREIVAVKKEDVLGATSSDRLNLLFNVMLEKINEMR